MLHFLIIFLEYTVARAQQSPKIVDDDYTYYYPDRPDGIQYSSGWERANAKPQRMYGTYHFTTKPGANLIYFFRGDAIYYYADEKSDHGPAKVYIDGDEKGDIVLSNSSSSEVSQRLLWSRTNLGPGDHQIVISHAGKNGDYIGLDFLSIESDDNFGPTRAGPAALDIQQETIIVDDTDLEHISYSEWEPRTSEFNRAHYNNSLHRTSKPGSSATFKFNGTAVWYVSDIHPRHGPVEITLDDEPSTIVNSNSGPNVALAQRPIWNATGLAYREHTVVITHNGTAGLYSTLDYFRYLPGEPPQNKSIPTGLIVGSAIGGLVALSLCVGGYIYLRRRQAARATSHSYNSGSYHPGGPPMLNHSVEATSQVICPQPVWGYTTEPSAPQRGQTASCGYTHGPSKGRLPRTPTQPLNNTAISSSSATRMGDSTENELTDDGTEYGRSVRPPPYA